jgi:hypothetical protein
MFFHLLHSQLSRLYGFQRLSTDSYARSAVSALRLSLVVDPGEIVMPAADVVQSPIAAPMSPTLLRLAVHDQLRLVGSSTDVDELVQVEQMHYRNSNLQPEWLRHDAPRALRPLEGRLSRRRESTTAGLKRIWLDRLEDLDGNILSFPAEQFGAAFRVGYKAMGRDAYLRELRQVPERLGTTAFLWRLVESQGVTVLPNHAQARYHFELGLAWDWLHGHLEEYSERAPGFVPGLGDVSCGLRHTDPDLLWDLAWVFHLSRWVGLAEAIEHIDLDDLLEFRVSMEGKALAIGLTSMRSLHDGQPDRFVAACTTLSSIVKDAQDPVARLAAGGRWFQEEALRSVSRSDERPPPWAISIAFVSEDNSIKVGDGSIVNLGEVHGDLNQVRAERIENSLNRVAKAPDSVQDDLGELHRQVAELLGHLSDEDQEKALKNLERLTEEVTASSPERAWYEVSSEGLIAAVKSLGAVAEPVIRIVGRILASL